MFNVTTWQSGVSHVPGSVVASADWLTGSVTLSSDAVATHPELATVGSVFVADGYGVFKVASTGTCVCACAALCCLSG